MGLLQLFYVASFPMIKVLLPTALGLFLALDGINILGEDAREKVNYIVFYVFNPSLLGSSLANTITFESVVLLWFMPVNVLGTYIIGSALGWILIRMTRPPKHMEVLILGCCSAGNLGTLPVIIIPAICKEKSNPFGEPDVCCKYGRAYASLSMAIGAVYLWSYAYNIIRISSSKVHKDGTTSNDPSKFKPYGETSESPSDAMDDAYTMLVPNTQSEEIVKVPISDKIKHHLKMISSNLNFKAMFSPATLEAIAGFIIGVIPQIRNFMIGSNAPLHVVEDTASMLGDAAIPTVTLILGANLLKGLKGTGTPKWTIGGIIAARFVFLPLLGVVVVKGAIHFGLVQSDPLYQFVLLLQYATPPAMNIGAITHFFNSCIILT